MMAYLKSVDAILPPEAEQEHDRKGILMKKDSGKPTGFGKTRT